MTRLISLTVLTLLLTFPFSVSAQQDLKALVGGRLIDGYGGPPLANSVILIKGNTIEAVGDTSSLPVPDHYQIISTEGMDVLPGLWDSHVHMMAAGHGDYRRWFSVFGSRILDEVIPAKGEQFLLSGVTTIRDLGAPLEPILEARRRFNEGIYKGPRLLVAGPFLQFEPYPGTELARWGIKDSREAKNKVNLLADSGVDFIKLIDIDWMDIESARTVVDTAHERGLKVIAHSRRPEEIRIGIELGIDNFEHSGMTSAPDYSEQTKNIIMGRTSIGEDTGVPLYWTPTASYYACQSTADEMATLSQDFALPVMDVIRGASYWPAKLMGVFDRWGTVEKGKYADIIAIKGDVLRYPALFKKVDLVMKDGTLYKENGQAVESAFEQ